MIYQLRSHFKHSTIGFLYFPVLLPETKHSTETDISTEFNLLPITSTNFVL